MIAAKRPSALTGSGSASIARHSGRADDGQQQPVLRAEGGEDRRLRHPRPGHLPNIAELAQQIAEIVECHRVTGEDRFIIKVHLPAMDQLDRVIDRFLLYGMTTTSIVQSSPVPLPPLPVPATE